MGQDLKMAMEEATAILSPLTVTEELRKTLSFVAGGSLERLESMESDGVRITQASSKRGLLPANLTTWELENRITLPDDIKSFFVAADGFSIKWMGTLCGEEQDLGDVGIRSLSAMTVMNKLAFEQESNEPGPAPQPVVAIRGQKQGLTGVAGIFREETDADPWQCCAPEWEQRQAVMAMEQCTSRDMCAHCFLQRQVGVAHSRRRILCGSAKDIRCSLDRITSKRSCHTDNMAAVCRDEKLEWLVLEQLAGLGPVVMDCCQNRSVLGRQSNDAYGYVWLVDEVNGNMHRLATCFSNYLRLLIVHLGMHCWQMIVARNMPWRQSNSITRLKFAGARFIPDRLDVNYYRDNLLSEEAPDVQAAVDASLFESMPGRDRRRSRSRASRTTSSSGSSGSAMSSRPSSSASYAPISRPESRTRYSSSTGYDGDDLNTPFPEE